MLRVTDLTPLDDEAVQLLEVASEVIDRNFAVGRHHVACALLTGRGSVYLGLHLDCAGFDNCAEPVAIANACLAGDTDLRLLVAVVKDRVTGAVEVVNPCGNCRQHLLTFAPGINVIGRSTAGLRRLTLTQLFPYPYGS
jgi:cytidine deaminase